MNRYDRLRLVLCVLVGLSGMFACAPDTSGVSIAFAIGDDLGPDYVGVTSAALSGIEHHEIEVFFDSSGQEHDSETEIARARTLLAVDNLIGVVGHRGSRGSLVTAPLYNESGIPQVVPTGTSVRLSDVGSWTFTMSPDDSIEANAMVEFLDEELSASTLTLFYVTQEFGYGIRDGVVAEAARRSIEIVEAVPIPPEALVVRRGLEADLQSVVQASLTRGVPDVVLLATGDHTATTLIRMVCDIEPHMRFLATDGIDLRSDYRALVDQMLDQIYLVKFWDPRATDSLSANFISLFSEETGRLPVSEDALFFDGVMLLATAVHDVGPDREAVRDYLSSLGRGRPPYEGVTGPISFAPGRARPIIMIRADSLP